MLSPATRTSPCHRKTYLRHNGPEHVLCFAPTRSGKGVGLVIPTLLTWPGSAIVHDIKGENWQETAGFRGTFSRVLLFDPTNPRSDAYNPLLEIRRGEWEVRDAQNVADVLVDPEGSLERRSHWEKTSHSLLVGAILHVLYAEKDKTLSGVANLLSDPKRPIETTLRAMMRTKHLGEAGPHPVVASAARELLNKSPNERSGVLSTAMSFLGLYRDPVVAKVTSRCTWRIPDIVRGGRPTTLYLSVPPSDISRTKPLTLPVSPYIIQAGTVIAGALNSKVSSDLPGQLIGHVTQNVYDSPTGRYLLVPQGSTLFGTYNSSVSFGQQRTQVIWTRLIRPDGESIVLDRIPGADAIGQTGLKDMVDQHWGQLFRAALVTTMLSVGSEAGTSWGENNLLQAIRSGASNGFSMVGNRLIDRSMDVQPTLTDRPGLPFTLIVNRDLVLKPWHPHEGATP
ncbi:TrbI/VirB10 family protein [Komagataeibacter rhaeticus]|nr:hypothetical protein AA16663_1425 [Komagataeibacter rhaeticus DSM 16663]